MKRKLALFLVLAMMISLVPANVFAASNNSVTKVPKVSDDYAGWTTQAGSVNAPKLKIEEKTQAEFVGEQTVRLKLTNAEWNDDADNILNDIYTNSQTMLFDTAKFSADVEFEKRTDSTMDMIFEVTAYAGDDEFMISVPMVGEVTAAGDVKVTVDAVDGEVSEGTYTYAIAAGGDTVTTIEDEGDNTFGDTADLAVIEIAESKIGSLEGEQGIVLQLPAGFKWLAASEAGTLSYAGGFDAADDSDITIDPDNSRRLNIITADLGTDNIARGFIYIEGLSIKAESTAKVGDVKVKIYADEFGGGEGEDVTTEEFLVAKYSDYGVTAEADDEEADLPVIYAGDFEANDADEQELSMLIVEEEIASSWLVERRTRIEFPEWVKILSVEIGDDTDNFDEADVDIQAQLDETTADGDGADNYVEISGLHKAVTTDTTELDLTFFVSVKGDATGDIIATVKGTGVPNEMKVKLGTAKAPVTVTVDKVMDVKTGFQDQSIGKITITEADAEILETDHAIVLTMDDGWFAFSDTPDVKVTKGDLEIDEDGVDVQGSQLIIPVSAESSEASTIEITNAKVDLSRSVPEGDFWVEVGGYALVKNSTKVWDEDTSAGVAALASDDGGFDRMYVAKPTLARVITPADTNTKAGEKVVFTIDSKEYMVGANKVTADVAPYINEQGRTMLPLRAMANALGVADANILWNEVERSVTIFKGDRVVKVVIGQMSIMVNGTAVPMDTVAVIKDGRTMLPLRAIGTALGAVVTWDEATRTVTVQ